jgi:hypothetical protein
MFAFDNESDWRGFRAPSLAGKNGHKEGREVRLIS